MEPKGAVKLQAQSLYRMAWQRRHCRCLLLSEELYRVAGLRLQLRQQGFDHQRVPSGLHYDVLSQHRTVMGQDPRLQHGSGHGILGRTHRNVVRLLRTLSDQQDYICPELSLPAFYRYRRCLSFDELQQTEGMGMGFHHHS